MRIDFITNPHSIDTPAINADGRLTGPCTEQKRSLILMKYVKATELKAVIFMIKSDIFL